MSVSTRSIIQPRNVGMHLRVLVPIGIRPIRRRARARGSARRAWPSRPLQAEARDGVRTLCLAGHRSVDFTRSAVQSKSASSRPSRAFCNTIMSRLGIDRSVEGQGDADNLREEWTVTSLRIFGLAVLAILGVTSIASAADTRGAPSWSGWYVGANAGGGWGHSNSDAVYNPRSPFDTAAVDSTSNALNGALGGLQAGYNVQTGAFLFGFETDIQATGQQGDAQSTVTQTSQTICQLSCMPPAPPTVTKAPFDTAQKLPWFGTIRGRVGVTPSAGWLVYATGGLAYGEIKTNTTFTAPPVVCPSPCTGTPGGSVAGNFSQTRAGWVVGAGVETALAGHWTGKLEYLHVDFGDSNILAPIHIVPFSGTLRTSARLTDEIMRVGVNYHFGG